MQLGGSHMEMDTLRCIVTAARACVQLMASSAYPELPYHLLSIITFCHNQVIVMFKLEDFLVLHGKKHCVGSCEVLKGRTWNAHTLQTDCSQQQPSCGDSRGQLLIKQCRMTAATTQDAASLLDPVCSAVSCIR